MPEPKKNREDYLQDKPINEIPALGNDLQEESFETSKSDAIYDPTPKDITEHLEEIRNRLFLILGLGVLIFIICFNYSEFFISLLEEQAPPGSSFFQLKPGELLFSSFKASGFASLICISPIFCQQLLAFIRPGLKAREYSISKIVLLSVPLLFLIL